MSPQSYISLNLKTDAKGWDKFMSNKNQLNKESIYLEEIYSNRAIKNFQSKGKE